MPIPVRSAGSAGVAPSAAAPAISVIVPTAGRPESIERLLRGLARQSVPADRFEVLVTDDGTQPPVAPQLARLELPFALQCEWQPQRGPAAARNRAIAKARAPLLLILNDDAGPPADLIERHLAAHRTSPAPRAWLGGFDFAPECCSPFALAVTRKGVVFPFHEMRRGLPNPGRFFWTCNLSVPTAAVRDAGGFDETFCRPICEDVELGHRLEQRGVSVWFLEGAACLHHHAVDLHWFMKRQVDLGIWMTRLWRKHRDPAFLPWLRASSGDPDRLALLLEQNVRRRAADVAPAAREIERLDRSAKGLPPDHPAHAAATAAIAARLDPVNLPSIWIGVIAGLRGSSAAEVRRRLAETPAAAAR